MGTSQYCMHFFSHIFVTRVINMDPLGGWCNVPKRRYLWRQRKRQSSPYTCRLKANKLTTFKYNMNFSNDMIDKDEIEK